MSSRKSGLIPGAFALLLLLLAHNALAEPRMFFLDDFNGSALDGNKWHTALATTGLRYTTEGWILPPPETHYGGITVEDSRVTLDNPSPTLSFPVFPYVWTNEAFPKSGDFELRFRMRYRGGGFWGDGVRIATVPSPFEGPSPGSTDPPGGDYVLMIHQDNVQCRGPNVTLWGRPGEGSPLLPFDTEWHTYELRYEGDQSSLYIDNEFIAGPIPTPRPNFISLGVSDVACCAQSCGCCGCQWTSFSIDFIQVNLIEPTSTKTSSWGNLKARYR
jgi:hypothetical protein